MTFYHELKFEFLLGKGGDVDRYYWDETSDIEWGILHWACSCSDWEFIVWLVDYNGANPNLLTVPNMNNSLRFCYSLKFANFLLWRGCDPYHLNVSGEE